MNWTSVSYETQQDD